MEKEAFFEGKKTATQWSIPTKFRNTLLRLFERNEVVSDCVWLIEHFLWRSEASSPVEERLEQKQQSVNKLL